MLLDMFIGVPSHAFLAKSIIAACHYEVLSPNKFNIPFK